MGGGPDHSAVVSCAVGVLLGAAALCYFCAGPVELTLSLSMLGVLTAIAQYVMRNET